MAQGDGESGIKGRRHNESVMSSEAREGLRAERLPALLQAL